MLVRIRALSATLEFFFNSITAVQIKMMIFLSRTSQTQIQSCGSQESVARQVWGRRTVVHLAEKCFSPSTVTMNLFSIVFRSHV